MSGGHRRHSHFSRAKWSKAILWPCWVLQAVLLLALIGLFSYRLSHTITTWQAGQNKAGAPVMELVWESANIGLSLIGFAVVLVSIARLVAEILTPTSMLFSNLANFVLSGVTLALDVVVYIQRTDKQFSTIGLGLASASILLAISLAVYSMFVYRRVSRYDDYHLPHNVKSYGYNNQEDMAPSQLYDPTEPSTLDHHVRAASVVSDASRCLSPASRRDSTSPGPIQPLPEVPRRASYDHKRDTQFEEYRARRVSGSAEPSRQEADLGPRSSMETPRQPSYGQIENAYFEERRSRRVSGSGNSFRPDVDPGSHPTAEVPRRPSYDHKRDTSFEEYRARRISGSGTVLKDEVDLALSTEFGWRDERIRDKVLTSGNINAAHITTRPRGDSNPHGPQRQSSVVASLAESSISASSNVTPLSDLSRAHSLVMVPEHPEEHAAVSPHISRNSSYATSRSTPRYSEEREGLLGSSTNPSSLLVETVPSAVTVPSPLPVQQSTPPPHRRHPSYGVRERQSLELQQAQQQSGSMNNRQWIA